jgi:hypothetical protein
LYTNINSLPDSIYSLWNITYINTSPVCNIIINQSSILLTIPYDIINGKGISNYYVVHNDIIIPYYSWLIKRNNKIDSPIMFLGASRRMTTTNNKLIINSTSNAFDNEYNYWIKSIQIINNNSIVPYSKSFLHNIFKYNNKYNNINNNNNILCFGSDITIGTPALERPSSNLLLKYSKLYRRNILTGSNLTMDSDTLLGERNMCISNHKIVGIVTRKSRRKIINENSLINLINNNISNLWCNQTRSNNLTTDNTNCSVRGRLINFGDKTFYNDTVENDIKLIQNLSLLTGIQGLASLFI